MFAQAAMLPENAVAQDRTRRPRGRPRLYTDLRGDVGIGSITRRAQEGRDAVCAPEDSPSLRAHAPAWAFRRARRVPPRGHRAKPQDARTPNPRAAAGTEACAGCVCPLGIDGGVAPSPLPPCESHRTKLNWAYGD